MCVFGTFTILGIKFKNFHCFNSSYITSRLICFSSSIAIELDQGNLEKSAIIPILLLNVEAQLGQLAISSGISGGWNGQNIYSEITSVGDWKLEKYSEIVRNISRVESYIFQLKCNV